MVIVENSNITIANLGLIAGICDTLGICEYIDRCIPKNRKPKVSHGVAIMALLLNCLGFTERRLYIMPEFFEDIAIKRLLGHNIEKEQLNQYLFGEALDAVAEYGPTKLFSGIVLEMIDKIDLGILRLHYDTTSVSVNGEYNRDFNTRLIKLTYGHSKDHRNDLKQFVISLVTEQRGIPVFMEPFSGNASDKKILIQTITKVRESLNIDEKIYHMADSALYSAENVQTLLSNTSSISTFELFTADLTIESVIHIFYLL
jgi:transposase